MKQALSRYNIRNLAEAVRNPYKFYAEFELVGQKINAGYHQMTTEMDYDQFIQEDWDNMIILDGCRYDLYSLLAQEKDELTSRNSGSSESWEFLQKQFSGREINDTIYITANPHAEKLDPNPFFYTKNLLNSHWDEELITVTPDKISEETINISNKFPNKRIISHFMQPHYPFIGELGQKLDQDGISTHNKSDGISNNDGDIWTQLRERRVNFEQVWEAYRENLEVTLPHVYNLIEHLDGISVVTSDHGNLIGERLSPLPVRGYGHPKGTRHPNLQKVPWHVFDKGTRKEIRSEDPIQSDKLETDLVQDRLESLGYR